MAKTLTIFTPTYNRVHTLGRTYASLCRQTIQDFEWLVVDDGSCDGTRQWIESLGRKLVAEGSAYDWMGRLLAETDGGHFLIESKEGIRIEYVYKQNGGLYTGYNVAFSTIKTELCVCIDSDDYMPDNAVEIIVKKWNNIDDTKRTKVGGIMGLDYNVVDHRPIGGLFKKCSDSEWTVELQHHGDCKFIFRTTLIRQYAPQEGFDGEKDFNPHFMQMQLLDNYPMIVLNENLCWVEYQTGSDSMSEAIFKQFVRSPHSYVRYRLKELELKHGNNILNRFRLCSHYVSSCIFAKDKNWLRNTPYKTLTILATPIGLALNLFIRWKTRK